MKLRFILALFVVIFFVCSVALAQDVPVDGLKAQIERMEQMLEAQQRQISELKRILEEKGKVKEKEGKEVVVEDKKIEDVVGKYLEKKETKEKFAKLGILPNLNMGYKKGFYLETLDEKYKLLLGGVLQFRYEYQDLEGADDVSSFSIRRARLIASGHAFSPAIQYKLQAGADKGKGFTLLDYYVDLRQLPLASFKLGQFKVPFNRQRITSASDLQFVDRSIANDEFNLDRDLGFTLHGEPLNERVEYSLGIFNGSGLNQPNDNNEHLYVIRTAYNPFGKFGYEESDIEYSDKLKATVAGALAFNSKSETGGDVDTTSTVFETGLKYKGFSFLTEYYYRHKDLLSQDDQGFFAQTGYFIVPKKVELTGRYSLVAYDNNPSIDTKREITGGLNYFFSGHRSKLQANYTRLGTDLSGNDKQADIFKLQYQFSF